MKDIIKNIIYMAKRFKLATLLNVVGLILAFALFYMLMAQILYQATFNQGLENHERIYRLDNNYIYKKVWDYNDNVCQCFAEALKLLPQVESFALIEGYGVNYKYKKGDEYKKFDFYRCSPKAISTLAGPAIDGVIEWDDTAPNDYHGLVIPASIAMDYFGTVHAAGDTMLCVGGVDSLGNERIIKQSVRGVYKDFPNNSEIRNCIYWRMDTSSKYYFDFQYRCFVKFAEVPNDIKSLEAKLKQSIMDYININSDEFRGNVKNLDKELDKMRTTNFRFTPLDYYSYFQKSTYTSGKCGFGFMPNILRFACLFLIIIATINFLNFTLAESPTRIRGLNIRLVLGAERRYLRFCIVSECVILSVVTCLAGIVLCSLLPLMHISNMPFTGDLSVPGHWGLALLTLCIAVVIGVAAGIYPAIFATSFAPAKALKGFFGLAPQGHKLRTTLVSVQLFISMLMTIYIGILFLQNHYIFNQPYGFDKNKLLYANIDYIMPERAEELERNLRQLPGIKGVSFAEVLLAGTDGHYEIQSTYRGHQMDYYFTYIDPDYMRTMGIKPIEGRDFSDADSAAIIINEAARQQWPWLKLGDKISTDTYDVEVDSVTVIGVCQNIRYSTMLVKADQPFGFILNRNDDGVIFTYLLVRVIDGADMEDTRLRANVLLQDFLHDKDSKYTLTPYNNCVAASYETELRFFRQMYIIGFSCIIITLIGLFCLTMFETEYQRKEIGIRKVAGATTGEIVWMLCRRYGLIILLCFAVAAPIAWYYGQETLKHFADHATILWWIFPLSLLLVGGIMLGTVALQSWLAARKNPSSTITTE